MESKPARNVLHRCIHLWLVIKYSIKYERKNVAVIKNKGLEARISGFCFRLCHGRSVWLWKDHFSLPWVSPSGKWSNDTFQKGAWEAWLINICKYPGIKGPVDIQCNILLCRCSLPISLFCKDELFEFIAFDSGKWPHGTPCFYWLQMKISHVYK